MPETGDSEGPEDHGGDDAAGGSGSGSGPRAPRSGGGDDSRAPSGSDGPRRNRAPALLSSLLGDSLDPGYAEAAARRDRVVPPLRRRTAAMVWYLVTGVLTVGLVLGIAVRATAASAPSAERTRLALLGDVRGAEQRVDQLAVSASALAGQIRVAQSELGAGGALASVTSLEGVGAMLPVRGPGLQVVIDGSGGGPGPAASHPGAGVILDRDIALLVNGLWASGAEAISVGGVRLRTTSAIRQAGGAILIDNTPVFYPLTIRAIGNPSDLHVAFASTEGFARFAAFASLYGIRFDVNAATELTMPGAPGPDLHYAKAVTPSS